MSTPNGSTNGHVYAAEAHTVAAKLRVLTKPFPITVSGPGGEALTLIVRRPDLRRLAYENRLPTPLLAKVAELLRNWITRDLKDKTETELSEHGTDAIDATDRLLAEALVEPRFALDVSDLDAVDRETVLTPSDLPVDVKERILALALAGPAAAAQALKEDAAGAARFPGDGPGQGTAPDVQGVRPAAE